MNQKKNTVVAIIGAGPRGLSALESLYASLADHSIDSNVQALLFEETDQLGCGPVYDQQQPDSNWLNVSERGLTIPERKVIKMKLFTIDGFSSYQKWCGFDKKEDTGTIPDYFPLRSRMGEYLNLRFQSIAEVLLKHGFLKIVKEKVTKLEFENAIFQIYTESTTYEANEVVLTIGHQPTEMDEQLTAWRDTVKDFDDLKLITNIYPIDIWLNDIKQDDIIGLRGFGLAMIDAARALTEGLGGSFQLLDEITRKMKYYPSKNCAVHLVPFSLNGLPMTPKPLTLSLDKPFIPSDTELQGFNLRLKEALLHKEKITDNTFLIKAIVALIASTYLEMQTKTYKHERTIKELEHLATEWLHDGSTEDPLILSKELSAYKSTTAFVGMATGEEKVSFDYCIGQVWRHCQPTMYKALSFSSLDDKVIADIIQLDERLKRYSYGPPVDSLTQLLALVDEGTMSFDFINDPDIVLTKKGWEFADDGKEIVLNTMIETVLDSPKLLKVNSPLVKSLLSESLVKPVHDTLGIATGVNAIVELDEEKELIPLAVVGRLAKGTIVGVDAILECFGERSELWAKGVVKRL